MSIFPDKRDGRTTGLWKVEVQYKGVRKRGRFATKSEAEEAEAAFLQELTGSLASSRVGLRQRNSTNEGITIREAWNSSRDKLWTSRVTESTNLASLERSLAHLGWDRLMDSITTKTIDNLRDWLLENSVTTTTVNRHLQKVRFFLAHHHDRHQIREMPKFTWFKEIPNRIRWITQDEEKELVSLLRSYGRDDIADLVKIAIVTGMRRGELLGLQRDHVDAGWVRLWETKNDTPRSVPIEAQAQAILDARVPFDLPLHTLRHYWNRAKEDMGLAKDPNFVFHTCRHTCATRLIEAGVNVVVVQKMLGHKRIETTLRYAHVSDDLLRDAARKLNALAA